MDDTIRVFSIAGTSMYPLFSDGDIVIGKIFNGRIRMGNCYGFTNGTSRIFHRFVCRTNNRLIFSGDNSRYFESVELQDIFFSGDPFGPWMYNYCILLLNILAYKSRLSKLATRLKPMVAKKLSILLTMERTRCARERHISNPK